MAFFEVKSPLSTSVYFSASCFGEAHKKTLLNVLRVGQRVGFNAKLGQEQNSAQYRASDVWLLGDSESDTEEPINVKPRSFIRKHKDSNSRVFSKTVQRVFTKEKVKEEKETIKSSSKASLENCVGKIQNIYDTYGFISKENDERIFFHLNAVVDSRKSPNISDLRKLFKKGDPVRFLAIPSVKKDSVPWQATSVWLYKDEPDTVNSGDELFMSSSGDEECNVGNRCKSQEAMKTTSSSSTQSLSDAEEQILNCQGQIYPNTDNTAEIKFGKSFHSSALAESCDFYHNGFKITDDLMWEFKDGDSVLFDAVKIITEDEDFYWKATLVWVGKKPVIHKCNSLNNLSKQPEKSNNFMSSSSDKKESKFETPKYTNWGDTPYSEEEEEQKSETKSKDNCQNFVSKETKISAAPPIEIEIKKEASSNKNNSPLQGASALPTVNRVRQDNQLNISDKEDNEVPIKVEPKQYIPERKSTGNEPIKENNDEINVDAYGKNQSDAPGVYMFQKLKGQVVKLFRYMAQLKCESLRKSAIPLLLNDVYCNGKPFKDMEADPRDLLFVDDLIYFNGFEILDDNGKLWQKVTLAWKGEKPKQSNKDMEPKEFIESEKIKVSGPIPCWKSFRNKAKQDSIVMINTTSKTKIPTGGHKPSAAAAATGRKFLTAIEPEMNDNDHNIAEEVVEGDEDEEFDERRYFHKKIQERGVPDSLVFQFTNITNSMNALRRNFASFATLKDFDQLATNINDAIDSVLDHLSTYGSNEMPMKGYDNPVDLTKNVTMQNAKMETISMTSTASQTLVTGDVIARGIFPQ